jgi:hypothetical protein
VDRIPLEAAVLGLDDGPGCSGEDRPAPSKAILQSDAEEEVMERAGPIETPPFRLGINADEIIGVSLAEDLCPMAWDFLTGGVRGNPFAPKREVYDDRSRHRGILALRDTF